MRLEPIILLDTIYGKLNHKAGYYIRRSKNGRLYSCKCPDRSNHVKTPAEIANQHLFAETYAGKNKKQ